MVLKKATVRDLYQHYKHHHLPRTRAQWRADAAWKQLEPVFGDMLPEQIDVSVTDRYANRRKGRSDATINRELGVLSALLAHARKHRLTAANPFIQKRPPSPPKNRVLTKEEQHRLLDACREDPPLLLFVQLALLTGQRREALVTLKWSQVDWQLKHIDFRDHQATNQSRMKGRGVVPFDGELQAILTNAYSGIEDGYVIAEWEGDGHKATVPFRRACKRAGITGATPHTLRHTVATTLVRLGVPLLEVSRLLGHKSVVTTERNYLSLTPDYIANAASKLSLS